MQSFMPIYFFVFNIQTIRNGFPGPKRFPEGPEKFSGPESHNKNLKP